MVLKLDGFYLGNRYPLKKSFMMNKPVGLFYNGYLILFPFQILELINDNADTVAVHRNLCNALRVNTYNAI